MSEQTLDVFNPSNGQRVETITADTLTSAREKLHRLHRGFHQGNLLPLHERIAILKKLSAEMMANKSGFLSVMVQEGGKPYKDSEVEFNRAVQGVQLAIDTISREFGHVVPLGYQRSSAGRFANTRFFPRGVVLAFSAFNHPLNLIVHQVIPAVASGCPCLIKPAPDTPLSCLRLVDTMYRVGVPEDHVQVVITQDNDIAGKLVESDNIDYFSFVGSAKVGWMLRSRLRPGVKCALEHGGVAPCIVSAQADLTMAVDAITKGGFYHAGQVCVSTQRVYVDAKVREEFTQCLVSRAEKLVVGDAMSADTEVGPIIRKDALDRIDGWVSEAIQGGAKCLIGGKPIDDYFYPPTILLNPSEHAKVTCEEVFGPVVCVYSYDDFGDVLKKANHSQFAFQASIFTGDIDEAFRAYESIEASALLVNDHTAFRDDVMPFGGLKHSGLGVGGIPQAIADMQYEKMLLFKT